jgi:glycine cleavage system aminomethyltransferase T
VPSLRQTALLHAHERAGASLVEHHGWQVPAFFMRPQEEAQRLLNSAGLSDLSWMTKLDLKGYGLKTPPAVTSALAWRLGPRHYLVTCEPPEGEAVVANLLSFPAAWDLSLPPPVYLTDVTSVYAHFLLAGPRSREILRKLTSLNLFALENLTCGQAGLAHVHSIVLRSDFGGVLAFHILVSREYGESVWEALLHAGHELQLAPFGLAALESLGKEA